MNENNCETVTITCPNCQKDLSIQIPTSAVTSAPDVRAQLTPVAMSYCYKITSDDICNFVTQKARQYCPGVKATLVPIYSEKPNRKPFEPLRSYASLRIAFSHDVIEDDSNVSDLSFYTKLGKDSNHLNFVPSLFANVVGLYGYNRQQVESWEKDYKTLEDLENAIGLGEKNIDAIKEFITPRRVSAADGSKWIIFAAAPEKVIKDMLTNPETQKPIGKIMIESVEKLSDTNVEFTVQVFPGVNNLGEKADVRHFLLGKKKK